MLLCSCGTEVFDGRAHTIKERSKQPRPVSHPEGGLLALAAGHVGCCLGSGAFMQLSVWTVLYPTPDLSLPGLAMGLVPTPIEGRWAAV